MNCCTHDNRIVIVSGDDTQFNDGNLLTIELISDELDFSEFTAKFVLGGITKSFDDLSSGIINLNYNSQETSTLPYGNINGTLYILDSLKRRATIETIVPFFVTSTVVGTAIETSQARFSIDVKQGGINILKVNFVSGGGASSFAQLKGSPYDNENLANALNAKQGVIEDLSEIREGAALGSTALQSISSQDVVNALGYTPYNSTNPDGFQENVIEDVKVNGTSLSVVEKAVDITVPTETSELNNDSGFITLTSLTATNNISYNNGTGVFSVSSGYEIPTSANITQITTNKNDIRDINILIPAQATTNNQLADKDFVNSSIATSTANFIGTFNDVASLEAYSGTVTNNDYAFVVNSVVTDNGNDWASFNDLDDYDKSLLTNFDYAWVINGSNFDLYRFDILNQLWDLRATNIEKASVSLNKAYNRYKASVSGNVISWDYEYTLNNSSFTANQWAAINSGATSGLVSQITTNQNAIGILSNLDTTTKTDLVSSINEVNTTAGSKVSDVQVNGTTVTTDGIANIPDAQPSGTYGVIKLGTTSNGLAVSSGNLVVYGATTTDIDSKLNSRRPITPSTLDYSVKVGMTTNTETLTSTEKTSACGWLGALQGVKVKGTALTPDSNNEVDVPLMTSSVFGVAKLGSGLQVGSSGDLKTYKATDAIIDAKSNAYMPIVPSNLDYAVKVGITTNTNTLTASEKQKATDWILPAQTNEMVLGSDGTNASWDYPIVFCEWVD